MRVARRREGFFYVDLKSGEVSSSRPGGIEVPRWSIKLPSKVSEHQTLLKFDGPSPA